MAPTTSSKGVTYFLELLSKVLGVTLKDLMLLLSKGSGHWAAGLAWHTVSLFLAQQNTGFVLLEDVLDACGFSDHPDPDVLPA